MTIELQDTTKTYRSQKGDVRALDPITLTIEDHRFVSLLGPSGCGKTTLLKIIDGLLPATSGRVLIDGREVTGPGPDRTVVFQDFALLPWRTVAGNVSFALEPRGVRKAERASRVRGSLELVGLEQFADALPRELSGGMQQRVGLARALVAEPRILLLDEPFGALDAQTRQILQDELDAIWERTKCTAVLVTHSVEEAIYLSDTIVVFTARPGRVKAVRDVPFPRPRDSRIRTTTDFQAMREQLWDLLRVEVGDRT